MDKDEALISLLRDNARMPVAQIARELHVSRTAAQARLDKLEKIRSYPWIQCQVINGLSAESGEGDCDG